MTSSQARHQRKTLEKLQRKAEQESPLMEFNFHPMVLAQVGPVIETDVGVTPSHEAALKAAGEPVATPVRCRFLVDTGADLCVIKHEFAERAGLKLIASNVPLHGVGVDTTGRIYMGRVFFGMPSRSAPGMQLNIAVDTEILSGTLHDSQTIDGILGRNVLARFDLRYNGQTGKVSLRFIRLPSS